MMPDGRAERILAVILFVLTALGQQLIVVVLPQTPGALILSLLILGVVYYAAIGILQRTAARVARRELKVAERRWEPKKGLIVLASPASRRTPAENAVKAHLPRLEHCWIIAGPAQPGQTPTAEDNARRIASSYGNGRHFYIRTLKDEHSPQQVYRLVRSIYEEAKAYGLRDRDIVADYTGGTKSMGVGMALACSTSEDRDAEYMRPAEVTEAGVAKPQSEAEPILIDLGFGRARDDRND